MTDIAGVPAQFFQDALITILDAHPAARSMHCDAIVVATSGLPCVPTDERLAESWVCVNLDSGPGGHYTCITRNIGKNNALYCECSKAHRIVDADGRAMRFYTLEQTALCKSCQAHEKKETCPFCGEVHD